MPPKLYLFHGTTSVRGVLITAKALGITLEHHMVDYEPEEHSDPDYLKHNPHHTVPTLDDDGQVLWGSNAINAYLIEKYGKDDSLYPNDPEKRSQIDEKLKYETTSLFPLLRSIHARIIAKEIKTLPSDVIEEIKKSYDFLETILKENLWITGNCVTVADFSLIPTCTSLDVLYPIDPEMYPNLIAWIKRAEAHPAFDGDSKELAKFRDFIRKFIT